MSKKEQILEMYTIAHEAILIWNCPKENTDCKYGDSSMDCDEMSCDECIACYALYNAGYRKEIK